MHKESLSLSESLLNALLDSPIPKAWILESKPLKALALCLKVNSKDGGLKSHRLSSQTPGESNHQGDTLY